MLELVKALALPLFSFLCMAMGSGLLNTCTSLRLEYEGFTPETIGVVSSFLYVGVLIGSLRIDRWIMKVGHLQALTLFTLAQGGLVALQGLFVEPIYWSILRLFGGIITAGVWIAIESWLLIQAPFALRGAAVSLYLTLTYIALSLGQFFTHFTDPKTYSPFLITSLLLFLGFISLKGCRVLNPKMEKRERMSLTALYKISPFGFFGGIIAGMVLAAIYSLMPIYGQSIGLEISEIGTLMGTIIFGGLVFQWPIGKLADQGRRRLLLRFASLLCGILGCLLAISPPSLLILLPLGWCFGGFAFVLYPLSITYACEQVPSEQIVAATGGFIFSYGIGSIAGPLLAPLAITWLGSAGLFYFLASITR